MIKSKMENRRGLLSNLNGFSLLELMIALAILSMGILAVAELQTTAINGSTSASRLTVVMNWSEDQAVEFLEKKYDDGDLNVGTNTPAQDVDGIDNDSDGLIDESGESGDYAITWTVVEDSPIENCKTITMTVTRNGFGFSKKRLIIEHIKADII